MEEAPVDGEAPAEGEAKDDAPAEDKVILNLFFHTRDCFINYLVYLFRSLSKKR